MAIKLTVYGSYLVEQFLYLIDIVAYTIIDMSFVI